MTRTPSVSDTVRRLAAAQKPASKGSPPYSVLVNRRLGRVFAALAFHVGLTPNQVSLISGGFTATGIALLALVAPSWPMAVAVTAALVVGYGLDSADGQLARLRGGGSPVGEWLDHVLDSAKIATLHLAVLIGWYRFTDLADGWLLVPLAWGAIGSVLFFAMWITERMRRELTPDGAAEEPAGQSWLRRVLLLPTDYGVLTLVMVSLPVTGLFVALYTLLFTGTLLFLVAALPKWFLEISRLGAAAASGPVHELVAVEPARP